MRSRSASMVGSGTVSREGDVISDPRCVGLPKRAGAGTECKLVLAALPAAGNRTQAAGLMLIGRAPRVKSCCLRDNAPVIAFRRIIEGDSPCRKFAAGMG